MNGRDAARLLCYVQGQSPLPIFNVIVGGERTDELTDISALACWYAMAPNYRVYFLNSQASPDPQEIRQTILTCHVPADRAAYHKDYVDGLYGSLSGVGYASQIVALYGVPLAAFGFGRTITNDPKVVFFTVDFVPVDEMLKTFQEGLASWPE